MNDLLLISLLKSDEPLEPETLYQLYPNLSPLEVQKVQIIKLILSTKFVHEDMDVFENAVYVINNMSPDTTKTEGCKPDWIWYALMFIEKIKHRNYSNEVLEYIKWNFKDAGLRFYPPIFEKQSNPLLQDIIYKATKGPFPLKENFLDIQVLHYMKIQEYIKEMKKTEKINNASN